MPARFLLACLALALIVLTPRVSVAAPGGSKGVSGSAKVDRQGARGSSDGVIDWPELVYGGNAISFLSPLQFGLAGYQPRVRLGVQYDRQWFKQHWLYGGAAALLDRGDFETFRLPECGLPTESGACDRGGVAGFDIWGGYAYKFYLQDLHYVVPVVRVGAGYSWWRYPNVRGAREQVRVSSYSLNARVGGGARVFFLADLAIGIDLNLSLGWLGHRDEPYLADDAQRSSQLGVGLELLPLIVEYRF